MERNPVGKSDGGHVIKSPYTVLISMALVLATAAVIRFYGITAIGVDGTDTFQYWHIATLWTEGDYVLGDITIGDMREFYRPVAYAMYAAALKLFDFQDYSIKIVNVVADLFNILLIFFIGRRLKNNWIGLFAAASYAFLPTPIRFCRGELLHTLSALYVLLSVLFLTGFLKTSSTGKQYVFLCLSGISMALSSNVHPSTAFLAPGIVAGLALLDFLHREPGKRIKNAVVHAFVYTASFFSVYAAGGAIFGYGRIYRGMTNVKSITHVEGKINGAGVFVKEFLLRTAIFLKSNISIVFALLFAALVICFLIYIVKAVVKKSDSKKINTDAMLFLIFITAFIVVNMALTSKRISYRLFIPLVPFVFFFHVFVYRSIL